MKLNDIESSLEEDKVINVTRPCWNVGNTLDFWASLCLKTAHKTFSLQSIKCSTLQTCVKRQVFSKLKDNTEVPDSFELDEEDLEADDWVII